MNGYEIAKAHEAKARAFARKVFDEAPPYVGFFPRPLSGVAREIVETMIARGYMEGVNAVRREQNGTS